MDSDRFDRLARSVSHVRSRRHALRTLAGVAAGAAALAAAGPNVARAGKSCETNFDCPKNQMCRNSTPKACSTICGGGETLCKPERDGAYDCCTKGEKCTISVRDGFPSGYPECVPI